MDHTRTLPPEVKLAAPSPLAPVFDGWHLAAATHIAPPPDRKQYAQLPLSTRAGRRRVGETVLVAAFQLGCSSSVRAWSIWSYTYVAISAVVIVSPLWASASLVRSPRTSRRWAIAVVISGTAAAEKGLSANPTAM